MDFKLIDVSTDLRMKEALKIYNSNPDYFAMTSNSPITMVNVDKDMKAVPNSIDMSQKNYKLISIDSNIVGIIDFITSYPEEDEVYIGLIMIDSQYHRKHIATDVVGFMESYFKKLGFIKVVLSVIKENSSALSLWTSLGYKMDLEKVGVVGDRDDVEVLLMSKRL